MSISRYKPDRFNFSRLSERMTFQVQNPDGTYTDNIIVWAHLIRDGFTRQESNNWFKILVREQKALGLVLQVGNRLKWGKRLFIIHSWHDPMYEQRGMIQILVKQISADGINYAESDTDIFRDYVAVYKLIRTESMSFGIKSFTYDYNFNTPTHLGVRCHFDSDRNRYLYDKKTDVENDSLVVTFNAGAPIDVEDYIFSPIHGQFKIDMIVKSENNQLLAHVSRSEVQ